MQGRAGRDGDPATLDGDYGDVVEAKGGGGNWEAGACVWPRFPPTSSAQK